jgi:hypothetical protein
MHFNAIYHMIIFIINKQKKLFFNASNFLNLKIHALGIAVII